MDRKSILVILLAALIALLTAYFIFKPTKQVVKDVVEPVTYIQEELVEAEEAIETVEVIPSDIKSEELNSQKVTNSNPKQVVSQTVKSTPTVNKVEEPEIIQTSRFEASIEEETIDYGLYVDKETKNIVVTRNFDSKSPTKYYFKDFGIIDKVVK